MVVTVALRRRLPLVLYSLIGFSLFQLTSRHIAWSDLRESYRLELAPGRDRAAPAHDNATTPSPDAQLDDGAGPVRPLFNNDPLCAHMPDTSNILTVMKTGASESFAKLPTQLLTTLRCLPAKDVLLVSDLEQQIVGRRVYDLLAEVPVEVRDSDPDFKLYQLQKECLVAHAKCLLTADDVVSNAWRLDRYKNIHMAELAWRERPGYDWYFYVDADTYTLWGGLVTLLSRLDPREIHYIGDRTGAGGYDFAHGGSGYVLSAAAMEALIDGHPGVGSQFDVRARGECCGDLVLAMALRDLMQITPRHIWPPFNGEKPTSFPFGPTHWCHPVVTMHHVDSEEVSTFWDWERQRPADAGPVLLRDIYFDMVDHIMQESRRDDWDNLSDDYYYIDHKAPWPTHLVDLLAFRVKPAEGLDEIEQAAHRGPDECARACARKPVPECFQWQFRNGACALHRSIRVGHPVRRAKKDEKRTISGWDMPKIKRWIGEQAPCGEVDWQV